MRWHFSISFILFLAVLQVKASCQLRTDSSSVKIDTLKISLVNAESALIKNNLQLMARHFDIDAARAQVLQARLWDNPTFYMETNPHNGVEGRYFYYPSSHAVDAQGRPLGNEVIGNITQLFKTAGKRGNLVELNQVSAEIAESVYYDVMRNLKLVLRTDYSLLIQIQNSIFLLDDEILAINHLVEITREQLVKGNFAEKDLLRLQALAFSLEMMKKDFLTQLSGIESEVRTIIGAKPNVYVYAIHDSSYLARPIPSAVGPLMDLADENRVDLKIYEKQVKYSEVNLKLQKSLAYPDVAVTANYTRYSNYILDYFGVGIASSLPILNRNQGNIKSARSSVLSSQSDYQNLLLQVNNQVLSAYQRLNVNKTSYQNYDQPFIGRFDIYFKKLIINFQRRVIGLIEFIDFFETYRDTKLASFNLEQDFFQSMEELNYYVGTDIVK